MRLIWGNFFILFLIGILGANDIVLADSIKKSSPLDVEFYQPVLGPTQTTDKALVYITGKTTQGFFVYIPKKGIHLITEKDNIAELILQRTYQPYFLHLLSKLELQ